MEFILIAIIIVLVIGVIAYPLFATPDPQSPSTANALDSLIAQRDSAYDAIRDLDFDYQLGKLSQADYELLRDKYKARAALALQQIDQLAGSAGAAERIEQEVARLRAQASRSNQETVPEAADAIEQEVARLRRHRERAGKTPVQANGHPAQDANAVEEQIARLRARRHAGDDKCSQCGTPYRVGDTFCSKCGARLLPR